MGFAASSSHAYGFDKYDPSRGSIEADYAYLMGLYKVRYVSLKANEEGKVLATFEPNQPQDPAFTPDKIRFVGSDGKTLTSTYDAASQQWNLTLPAAPTGESEVFAYYQAATGGAKSVGKMVVKRWAVKDKTVQIISLTNGSVPPDLEVQLNRIYAPALLRWKVEVKRSNVNFDFGADNDGGALQVGNRALLSNYSAEMKALMRAYFGGDKNEANDERLYVFLIPKFSDGSVEGYMPRGRNVGFMSELSGWTLAYELGHGWAGLAHTFPALPRGSTSNLMDYSQKPDLTHAQWDKIQNPGVVINWFDEVDDAASIIHPFVAPNGKVFNTSTATSNDIAFLSHNGRPNVYYTSLKNSLNGAPLGIVIKPLNDTYLWDGNNYKKLSSWDNAGNPVFGSENAPVAYQNLNNSTQYFRVVYQNMDCSLELLLSGRVLKEYANVGCKPATVAPKKVVEESPCPAVDNTTKVAAFVTKFYSRSVDCYTPLSLLQRQVLLKALLTNWIVTECANGVGNCYEPVAYNLILSTPASQQKPLLDYLKAENLLDPLFNKTQFSTFDGIGKTLAKWIKQTYPPAAFSFEGFAATQILFLENYVSSGFVNGQVQLNRSESAIIRENVQVVDLPAVALRLPADSYVTVYFRGNYQGFKARTPYRMSGIEAMLLFNKDRRDLLISTGRIAFEVGLLAVGVAEVSAAFRAYQGARTAYAAYIGTKALADLGVGIVDFVVNENLVVLTDVQKVRWNTASLVFAAGSISASVFDGLLRKYGRTLDNTTEVDNFLSEVEGVSGAGSKVKVLAKLDNLRDAKAFVNSLDDVADAILLGKIDGLPEIQLKGLDDFYRTRQSPAGFSTTDYNFTASKKLRNGDQASMTFKNGFPEFHNSTYCPSMSYGNGTTGKFKFQSSNLNLDNYSTHFDMANNSLLEKMGLTKSSPKNAGFYEMGSYRWDGFSSQFELKNADGVYEKYTWHHFEDGKTMIPVLSDAHTGSLGGFVHSGGNSIFKNNIKNVFEFIAF